MKIHLAEEKDAGGILAVYAPYVEETAVSFEIDVPGPKEFRERVTGILGVYPYLVCEEDGGILAFSYASRFRERAAYRFDVEVSVYIDPAYHGRGIGKALYAALFRLLTELGYYTAYAGITLPNERSVGLHEAFGFRHVGAYRRTGYKQGRWLDVALMEKPLREYDDQPLPPRRMGELEPAFVRGVLDGCGMIRENKG